MAGRNCRKNYMSTIQDFSGYTPTWCPGCGDYGIWASLKSAIKIMNWDLDGFVIVYGVGCSGNMTDFIRSHGFHSLHGRALPNAEGIKIANHQLNVVCVVGDGDCYGEGGNHLLHACRGNHDIYIIKIQKIVPNRNGNCCYPDFS